MRECPKNEKETNHSRNVKVNAAAPSATTLCQARESTTSPSALLVPVGALDDEVTEPPLSELLSDEVVAGVGVDDAEVEDVTSELDEMEETGRTELALALDPPIVGGATASEGSTRAPLPQGMGSPLGCFASVGGVLCPVASAIVKRVVHIISGLNGLVNW